MSSLGAVATVQGIGASLSSSVAGLTVVKACYSAAFLILAAVALVGFVIFLVAMPETGAPKKVHRSEAERPSRAAGVTASDVSAAAVKSQ